MWTGDDDKAELVAFLAGDSLRAQLAAWQAGSTRRAVRLSPATGAAAVRRALRDAGAAIVDATESPQAALDVFGQLVDRLERGAVAVYAEVLHAGLELPVRSYGAPLLLGPLGQTEWDELIDCLLRIAGRARHGDSSRQRRQRRRLPGLFPLRSTQVVRQPAASVRRPRTRAK